jgi:hypothetical protein
MEGVLFFPREFLFFSHKEGEQPKTSLKITNNSDQKIIFKVDYIIFKEDKIDCSFKI